MANLKPTLRDPMSDQSEKFENDFKKTMIKTGAPTIRETEDLNEVDGMLSEVEQSLKKKIFSLAKMEALVFSDPKLSAVYEDMAENGEEKYGYHYNETIQNMIFNDYVLNSPKYLQKYKMAIPKEKKRRDKSGINKLKKAGAEKMAQTGLPKQTNEVSEPNGEVTKVLFLVNERDPKDADLFAYFPEEIHNGEFRTAYSHVGQHGSAHPKYAEESRQATPEEYVDLQAELESIGYNLEVLNGMQESTSAGSAGGAAGYVGYAGPSAWSKKGDLMGNGKKTGQKIRKPIWKGGTVIQESEYLTDPSGFEKYVETLNEESDAEFVLNNSQAYGSVDNMNANDQKVIKKDIQNRKWDNNANIKDGIALQEEEQTYNFKLWYDIIPKMSREELFGAIKELDPVMSMEWLNDVTNIEVFKFLYFSMMMDRYNKENPKDVMNEEFASKAQQRYFYSKAGDKSLSGDERSKWKKWAKEFSDDTNFNKIPEKVDETMGQPDIDYLVKAFTIINSGPNFDPAKAEHFKQNLSQMSDQDAQQVSRTFDGILRQMGYTNPQDVMNFQNKFNEDTQTMIQNNGDSMSNKAQATGDMSSEVPMGTQQTSGLNESDVKLLEEINKELEAFSVHHDKLKLMSEDRKTTSQILNKRVNDENPKNFKKDLQHSGVKQVIDVEKELEWKDQQTEVDDPQKLGADIEKNEIKVADMKGDEALKNVGDSTNNEGDEIPKRNLTSKEQEEVDLYRNGLHSTTYDNEPSERFVERMKADQGAFFEMGEKQKEFKADAPMYNKDNTFVEDANVDKVQFDKNVKKPGDKVAWNERIGLGSNVKLSESLISGRYRDAIGENHMVDFHLSEAKLVSEDARFVEPLFELSFIGLGNKYLAKTVDKKVVVNEAVVGTMESHKFFTNGNDVFAVKNPVQQLNEGEVKDEKPVVNEEVTKMKHLFGYKPESYVSTKGVKQNRKF